MLKLAGLVIVFGCWMWAQVPLSHPQESLPVRGRLNDLTESLGPIASQRGTHLVAMHNYIDRHIFGKMREDGVPHAGIATDAEFLRRVHLDLTGRLPEPGEIRDFLADGSSDKRDKVIDRLMATPYLKRLNRPQSAFLDRWTYFFGDLFRNGTAQLGKGRNLFHDYLYMCLLMEVPYNQMVQEMLTARTRSNWLDAASNFLVRDHVDDDATDERVNHEDTYDEIAISTTKLFLGVNLECVSCHDGAHHLEKINLGLSSIERVQMWQQAAFFSRMKIVRPYSIGQEFSVLDTGKGYDVTTPSVSRITRYPADVGPRFLLTGESPQPGENWRDAYARMLTSHPQFAKATVNLIWAELMGVGIVDPPFGFDLARQDPSKPPPAPWTVQPSHPDLLDALANDFMEHNYSLRHIIRTIVKSSAYQLSSRFDGEWKESYGRYFARHFVRRLPAEMVADAVLQATGSPQKISVSGSDLKVGYVLQTRSPEDLGGQDLQGMRELLVSFGQSNRDKGEKDSSGNVTQAAVLLNGAFVKERVRLQEGGRLHDLLHADPPLDNERIVDEMFLSFLSRFPRPEEKVAAARVLEAKFDHGLEDLAWGLINKLEFIHNY